MKYKWKITITLKCGKEIVCTYEGEENNSFDVAKSLLQGASNEIIGLGDESQTTQHFIKKGEIAYMAISLG